MDINSAFIFSHDDAADTLYSRITLSSDQVERAREIKDVLLKEIKSKLSCKLGVDVKHWLQGSYKNHTLIRPTRKGDEFDIDAGIYLFCHAPQRGISAERAREQLRNALKETVNGNRKLKLEASKKNCERVTYDGVFHIDLPIYYFDEVNQKCRLASKESGWIDSDPKMLQELFQDLTSGFEKEDLAQLRRVIKYLKAWVQLKWKGADARKIPSLVISLYLAENYHKKETDYDAFIYNASNFSVYFLTNEKYICPATGKDLLDFKHKDITYARTQLTDLKRKCECILEDVHYIDSLYAWAELFEHLFPPIFHSVNERELKNIVCKDFPEPKLAICHTDNKRQKSFKVENRTVKAYKEDRIHLTITNTDDYPVGAQILWRVKNQGKEASDVYDLGHETVLDIYEKHEERCAYSGKHFIEIIIFKDGFTYGISLVNVSVTGNTRPLRNPPKKRYPK